jgi:hypothetical protein
MATAAADSASAMAPLRTTSDGDGCGRCFLAALMSGTAPPITVARVISQPRYCATSQVQSFSCPNAHLAWPKLMGSSLAGYDPGCRQEAPQSDESAGAGGDGEGSLRALRPSPHTGEVRW